MVGHRPLEPGILVRVQARQQFQTAQTQNFEIR